MKRAIGGHGQSSFRPSHVFGTSFDLRVSPHPGRVKHFLPIRRRCMTSGTAQPVTMQPNLEVLSTKGIMHEGSILGQFEWTARRLKNMARKGLPDERQS